MQHHSGKPGKVYLVGAGPGDPGLITVRGSECLGRADLVLYDYLVNPALLAHVRPDAEAVCLGHHGGGRTMPQEEIHAWMLQAAREGKTVVRLKGGDPDVFGRSAEESTALAEAGIPFETVPGVTAALAAAGYVGIPITHAEYSSAVALVAGQERQGKQGRRLNYEALAGFPGTLIFYMGVTSAPEWSEALIGQGKSPETPVVIVRRCTWSNQRVIRCTLGTVAAEIARQKLRPPAVIVVGEVARMTPDATWFTCRPLFGSRVLITRPREQAVGLADRLVELGADVLFQPAIAISDPPDWGPVDAALDELDRYDWLVFSSSNGVRYLLDRLSEVGGDLRRLGRVKLAAIGPGTADELARYRLRAELVPSEYRAESLAAALVGDAAGRRFLLARASRGREVLAEQLRAAGGEVRQVVVYTNTDVEEPDADVAEQMASGRIDWVTVTSSTIARSTVRLFGDHLRHARLASISPITSGVLRELGFEPAVEAQEYTMEGVVLAIAESRRGG
jgi:uroporphyrinogen III methyltransferase/synthase